MTKKPAVSRATLEEVVELLQNGLKEIQVEASPSDPPQPSTESSLRLNTIQNYADLLQSLARKKLRQRKRT